jgi:hypothetical protein
LEEIIGLATPASQQATSTQAADITVNLFGNASKCQHADAQLYKHIGTSKPGAKVAIERCCNQLTADLR